jgi:hypothetical protein
VLLDYLDGVLSDVINLSIGMGGGSSKSGKGIRCSGMAKGLRSIVSFFYETSVMVGSWLSTSHSFSLSPDPPLVTILPLSPFPIDCYAIPSLFA